jgi:hypothetical protein
MTILKSPAHILFAALIFSGSAALLGASDAYSEAKAKMDWPKYFAKTCETAWKDQMSEAELKSRCYYHKRPDSTYAFRALGEPTIAPAMAEPCIKSLINYQERACPRD